MAMTSFRTLGCLLIAAIGLQWAGPATAADFYSRKVLRIVVGTAAGAGYDLNARTLAMFLPDHIPGKPTVIVQNQPGAGSIIMTNSLYNNGPFDGLTIGAGLGGMVTAPLLQPNGVRYDVQKLNWLGTTVQDVQITYVWHTAPVKTIQDLRQTELVVGAQGPGSSQWDFPIIANALLHTKFKVVSGYESTPQLHTAMERGEVMGNGASSYTTLAVVSPGWLRDKMVNIILQWGTATLPELAGVPRAIDLAQTDADKQAIALVQGRLTFGKPFFLPPGVPADRVAILRRAFDETVRDPRFLAEEAKQRLEVSPLSGEEAARGIAALYATSPEVIQRVRDILAGSAS